MAEAEKTTPSSKTDGTKDNAKDLGLAEVQAKFDEAAEKGYFGEVPDSTPNENYTLKGVTSGKPTPETDRNKK
jgi:hypothetical protein